MTTLAIVAGLLLLGGLFVKLFIEPVNCCSNTYQDWWLSLLGYSLLWPFWLVVVILFAFGPKPHV